jgi:hypothetical protein
MDKVGHEFTRLFRNGTGWMDLEVLGSGLLCTGALGVAYRSCRSCRSCDGMGVEKVLLDD